MTVSGIAFLPHCVTLSASFFLFGHWMDWISAAWQRSLCSVGAEGIRQAPKINFMSHPSLLMLLFRTSVESEATMNCRLTTMAGNEVAVSINIALFDRFEDFVEHIVDYLATVSDLDVFGSVLDFIHPTTQSTVSGTPCKRIGASLLWFESASKSSNPKRTSKTVRIGTIRKQSKFRPDHPT